jgi:hypothetical protein
MKTATSPPTFRVRATWVAQRTSLTVRQVQAMAQARKIPAIKLGHVWTFDPARIEAWLQQLESAQCPSVAPAGACRPASIRTPAARFYGPASSSRAESIAAAYEQLIFKKRRS